MLKLIFAVLALAMAVSAAPVKAQMYDPRYPVCLHVYGLLEGERMDCDFTSIPQCQAAASGRSATCLINPFFAGPPGFVRRPHPRWH